MANLFLYCHPPTQNDWGFPDFYPEKDVLDESRGYCKNDSIILQVSIWADLPLGIRWDSKKSTGYVGLKNKQATCYLNSLLQALYFTNKLRKAVYQMPTESDDSSSSVALALQRVFYQMQFNEEAVNIQEFTSAFDWLSLDLATQYDVHDLCRLLFETLKVKMKNTGLADTIPKLFQGQMFTFICCKHVDFHSTQTEPFYDIQLNVRGNRNIYEAFDEYVSLETLTGEDKYDAGVYGLQEAEKGIMFESFPPVLHLHLLRFEYDPMDGENVKINDRFEFFEQINLSKYLIRRRPDESTIYILHAVLVRLGDYSSEHSLVYINTKGDGNWCKFDDDVVSFCLKEEAIQNNFGDGDDSERGINAYMLVYIRQGSDILEPVTDEMISGELVERLNESENRIQNGHHIQNRNLIENGNHIETISRSRYPKRQRTVP